MFELGYSSAGSELRSGVICFVVCIQIVSLYCLQIVFFVLWVAFELPV
jgi:hypothetical protein